MGDYDVNAQSNVSETHSCVSLEKKKEPLWQKFRKFQILVVVALDDHVLTKTSLIDIYVKRSTDEKKARTLIVH